MQPRPPKRKVRKKVSKGSYKRGWKFKMRHRLFRLHGGPLVNDRSVLGFFGEFLDSIDRLGLLDEL